MGCREGFGKSMRGEDGISRRLDREKVDSARGIKDAVNDSLSKDIENKNRTLKK